MGLFQDLVKSKFLANATNELALARNVLKGDGLVIYDDYDHPFDINLKKELYNYYLHELNFIQDLVETEYTEDEMIYYIQNDPIVFVYSRSKKQIENSLKYSHNLNGDLPVYRGRHRVKSRMVYTLLIDTRFSLRPASVN